MKTERHPHLRSFRRLLGLLAWVGLGASIGMFGGCEVGRWSLSGLSKLPPPRDATAPMELMYLLIGSAFGAVAAFISVPLLLAKLFPFSREEES